MSHLYKVLAFRWGGAILIGYWKRPPHPRPTNRRIFWGQGAVGGLRYLFLFGLEIFGWWVGCLGVWEILDQQAGECQSPEE